MSAMIPLIAAYFVVLAGISAAAMPYRRRMKELGAELRAANLLPAERVLVENVLAHAYSWRVSLMTTLNYLIGLFQDGSTLEKEGEDWVERYPNLLRDPRFHRLAEAFVASTAGVNPIFGMFAAVLRFAFRLKVRRYMSWKAGQGVADMRVAMTV